VVAGFYWLPEWGTPHLLQWTAILTLLGSGLFIRELPRRWALAVPGSLAVATIVVIWLPTPSYAELVARVRLDLPLAGKPQRTVFLKEGHTGVVSADEVGRHQYKLYNNGLNESRIDSKDGYNALLMESLLGLVPYLVHERPRSAFVVGLGGGATMRALEMSAIERLRVVELEARVREALETLIPPEVSGLRDPRLELGIGDARNSLLVEDRHYDIIVSQPSHPWRAGAANLFTREFFEIARSRLAPGGVYGQWLALFHMDPDTLRSIMGSFVSVFPHAFALSDTSSGDILFFGSTAPLVFVEKRFEARTREFHIRRLLKRRGVTDPVQLLSLFTFSRAEMLKASEGAPFSTDTNLLPEVRLGPVLSDPNSRRAFDAELKSASHFDIMPYLEPSVRAEWLSRMVPGLYARGDQRRARLALAALAKVDAAAAAKLKPRRRRAQ
jgi:hypothetical protein